MFQPRDHLIGQIAVREKLLTREQLIDCLQAQERNPSRPLGAVMVIRGYLRQEDINRLLELQRAEIQEAVDDHTHFRSGMLGRILIEKGLATEYQVNEGIRLQARLAELGIQPVPRLGDILIRRGYIRSGAVEMALQIQSLSLYACPECGHALELPPGPQSTPLCPACGREIPPLLAQMAAGVQMALESATDRHDVSLPEEVRVAAPDPKNQFGRYILVREIGRGGTGIVYKAWQRDFNKFVALKMLSHESDTGAGIRTPYGDAEDIKRFYNETRAAADLHHENIVPVLDFGNVDNHFYFTMTFIEGTTLDDLIRSPAGSATEPTRRMDQNSSTPSPSSSSATASPMTVRGAFELMLPLVRAASFAHERGIYHRDIKPGNIIVDRSGHPWLMDFGLAKVARLGDAAYVKGVIMGTPYYMPPEQALGDMEQVDHLSDIYSLGAVLYEMVTGRCPFAGKNADDVLDIIITSPPEPLSKLAADLPEDAVRIIEKSMRRRKLDRYPTAEAMAEDLKRFLEGTPLQLEPLGAQPAPGLKDKLKKMLGGE